MNKTLKITLTAVFTALCVVTNIFTIPLNPSATQVFSFVYFLCFVAGIYLGPISGACVGFLGDFIGHLIHPLGAYNPLIGLSCMLLGVIPALMWKLKRKNWVKLALSFVICLVICTAFLNCLGIYLFINSSKGFFAFMLGRMAFQAPVALGNLVLIYIVVASKFVDKLLLKANANFSKEN